MKKPAAIYLGIDPGANGGIAVLGADKTSRLYPLASGNIYDWWGWLRQFTPSTVLDLYVMIERNTGYTGGKSGKGNPGSRMFAFGANYGTLLGMLVATGIPPNRIDKPTPVQWQRGLGISPRKKGESKGQWKKRLMEEAFRLFPSLRGSLFSRKGLTLATADAILIAEYCRRKHCGY